MRHRSGVGGTAWLIAGMCLLPAPGFGQGTSGPFVSDSRVGYIDVGDRSDVYAGYGRALTGERWYEDSVRVENRLRF